MPNTSNMEGMSVGKSSSSMPIRSTGGYSAANSAAVIASSFTPRVISQGFAFLRLWVKGTRSFLDRGQPRSMPSFL